MLLHHLRSHTLIVMQGVLCDNITDYIVTPLNSTNAYTKAVMHRLQLKKGGTALILAHRKVQLCISPYSQYCEFQAVSAAVLLQAPAMYLAWLVRLWHFLALHVYYRKHSKVHRYRGMQDWCMTIDRDIIDGTASRANSKTKHPWCIYTSDTIKVHLRTITQQIPP